MNIHIMIDDDDYEAIAYSSFEESDETWKFAIDHNDVRDWTKSHGVCKLKKGKRFCDRKDANRTGFSEYLLTEKQSALFLLRFK